MGGAVADDWATANVPCRTAHAAERAAGEGGTKEEKQVM